MIHQILVDYRDAGDYFRFSVESDMSPQEITSYFHKYSHDIRYWRSHDERRKCDKGTRVTPVGTIVSCGYFGTKVGYNMRFESNEYKLKSFISSTPDERHRLCEVTTGDRREQVTNG